MICSLQNECGLISSCSCRRKSGICSSGMCKEKENLQLLVFNTVQRRHIGDKIYQSSNIWNTTADLTCCWLFDLLSQDSMGLECNKVDVIRQGEDLLIQGYVLHQLLQDVTGNWSLSVSKYLLATCFVQVL